MMKIWLYGQLPVSVLGIAGNVISIWVFSTRKKSRNNSSSNMTPYFVFLGVADVMFLLSCLAFGALQFTGQSRPLNIIVSFMFMDFFSALSMTTTLTIGVLRWMAVARPHWMRQMTRRHVVGTFAALISWSVVILLVSFMEKTVWSQGVGEKAVKAVRMIMGFFLPTLLLAGFSAALVVAFRHQGRQVARQQRRVTMMVLVITGSSLVSYPATVLIYYLMFLKYIECSSVDCLPTFFAVAGLLMAVNSSINFPLYVSLSSSFREGLHRKFQCGQTAQLRSSSGDLAAEVK